MKKVIYLAVALSLTNSTIAYDSWYKDQKRGWFWFEDQNKDAQQKKLTKQQSPVTAAQILEQFKKELDDARSMMMAFPSPENMTKYLRLEAVMWQRAQELERMQNLAQFMHPEFNEMTNVPAIKIRRQQDAESLSQLIANFAQDFELLYIRSGGCHYCAKFELVVKNLCDKYGFGCEALSVDSTKAAHFATRQNINLLRGLKIQSLPTLLMVHKTKPITLELAVGLLPLDELEQRFALVAKYLESKKL